MHPKELKNIFLKPRTSKLNKESNKEIILLGDVNTGLIKTNSNNNASEFLYIIYSSYLIPRIASPTRLTDRSYTIIDNIMNNVTTEDAISGNIINIISDHLGQFLILPYHSITSSSKREILQKNLVKTIFFSDLKKINWESLFPQDKQDVSLSYQLFLVK